MIHHCRHKIKWEALLLIDPDKPLFLYLKHLDYTHNNLQMWEFIQPDHRVVVLPALVGHGINTVRGWIPTRAAQNDTTCHALTLCHTLEETPTNCGIFIVMM